MLLVINGQQWEVLKVGAHHPGLYVENTARAGAAWPMAMEVYLSDELKGDSVLRTIIHELGHAWLHSTQISQQETWSEEELCELLSIYGPEIVAASLEVHKQLYPEVKPREYHIGHCEVRR